MPTQLDRSDKTSPSASSAPPSLGSAGRLSRATPWVIGALAVVVGGLAPMAGWSVAAGVVAGWFVFAVGLVVSSARVEGRRKAIDRTVTMLVYSTFSLAVLPLLSLLWVVIKNGAPALSSTFFTYSMRNVVGEGGGIYHAIIGTLLITAAAAVMSIPVGLFTAIYIVEYGTGSRLARWITFLVDVMTGIPSIVAGLFAYALFVLFFGEGVRMGFMGSVALSLLMIPLVVRSCEEMLKLVPNELREASYALGVRKWRTVVQVVVRTAMAGIVTGIMLAIARVIGETAPLLVTAGTTDSVNFNLFGGHMASLPVFAFSSFRSPGVPPEPGYERAWGTALVLMMIVMLFNLVARTLAYFFAPKIRN
jgi:phosphate transport system permease protein